MYEQNLTIEFKPQGDTLPITTMQARTEALESDEFEGFVTEEQELSRKIICEHLRVQQLVLEEELKQVSNDEQDYSTTEDEMEEEREEEDGDEEKYDDEEEEKDEHSSEGKVEEEPEGSSQGCFNQVNVEGFTLQEQKYSKNKRDAYLRARYGEPSVHNLKYEPLQYSNDKAVPFLTIKRPVTGSCNLPLWQAKIQTPKFREKLTTQERHQLWEVQQRQLYNVSHSFISDHVEWLRMSLASPRLTQYLSFSGCPVSFTQYQRLVELEVAINAVLFLDGFGHQHTTKDLHTSLPTIFRNKISLSHMLELLLMSPLYYYDMTNDTWERTLEVLERDQKFPQHHMVQWFGILDLRKAWAWSGYHPLAWADDVRLECVKSVLYEGTTLSLDEVSREVSNCIFVPECPQLSRLVYYTLSNAREFRKSHDQISDMDFSKNVKHQHASLVKTRPEHTYSRRKTDKTFCTWLSILSEISKASTDTDSIDAEPMSNKEKVTHSLSNINKGNFDIDNLSSYKWSAKSLKTQKACNLDQRNRPSTSTLITLHTASSSQHLGGAAPSSCVRMREQQSMDKTVSVLKPSNTKNLSPDIPVHSTLTLSNLVFPISYTSQFAHSPVVNSSTTQQKVLGDAGSVPRVRVKTEFELSQVSTNAESCGVAKYKSDLMQMKGTTGKQSFASSRNTSDGLSENGSSPRVPVVNVHSMHKGTGVTELDCAYPSSSVVAPHVRETGHTPSSQNRNDNGKSSTTSPITMIDTSPSKPIICTSSSHQTTVTSVHSWHTPNIWCNMHDADRDLDNIQETSSTTLPLVKKEEKDLVEHGIEVTVGLVTDINSKSTNCQGCKGYPSIEEANFISANKQQMCPNTEIPVDPTNAALHHTQTDKTPFHHKSIKLKTKESAQKHLKRRNPQTPAYQMSLKSIHMGVMKYMNEAKSVTVKRNLMPKIHSHPFTESQNKCNNKVGHVDLLLRRLNRSQDPQAAGNQQGITSGAGTVDTIRNMGEINQRDNFQLSVAEQQRYIELSRNENVGQTNENYLVGSLPVSINESPQLHAHTDVEILENDGSKGNIRITEVVSLAGKDVDELEASLPFTTQQGKQLYPKALTSGVDGKTQKVTGGHEMTVQSSSITDGLPMSIPTAVHLPKSSNTFAAAGPPTSLPTLVYLPTRVSSTVPTTAHLPTSLCHPVLPMPTRVLSVHGLSTFPYIPTAEHLPMNPQIVTYAGQQEGSSISTATGQPTILGILTHSSVPTSPCISTSAGLHVSPSISTSATAPQIYTFPNMSRRHSIPTTTASNYAPAGLHTVPHMSTPTTGLPTIARIPTVAGLPTSRTVFTSSDLPVYSSVPTPAGLPTLPSIHTPAALSTGPRVSTHAGLSIAPRATQVFGQHTAPTACTPASLSTRPRVSILSGPMTYPRVSTPAGLITAQSIITPAGLLTVPKITHIGLSTFPRVSTPAGLSTAPRFSTSAGLSKAPRFSTPGLLTAPRLSRPTGLSTAPRLSRPAGLSTAPRLSRPAGLSTASRLSRPAGLSTAPRLSTPAGLSTAPRHSRPAGLSTAPRVSIPAGLSTAPRHSRPADLSTAPRVSTPAGQSTAPRVSTPAGLSTAPRVSTPAGLSTAPRVSTPAGLSTAPRVSTPAGLLTAPRVSTPAGLSTAPRVSTPAGLSTAPRVSTPGLLTAPRVSTPAGLSTAPRVSTPAGLSTAPRVSTPAGLSTAPRVSTPAGLSTAPRVSTPAGLSTAPRVSTPAGLSTAPRVSTPAGLSTAPRVSTPAGLSTAPRVSTPAGLSTAPRDSTLSGLPTTIAVTPPVSLAPAPSVLTSAGSPTTTAVTTFAGLSTALTVSTHADSPTTTAVTTFAGLSTALTVSTHADSPTTTAVTTFAGLSTALTVSTPADSPTTTAVTTLASLSTALTVSTHADSPTTTAVTTFAGLSTALTVSTHADSPTTTAVTTFAGLSTALTVSTPADSPTTTAVTTLASLPPALTVSSPDDSPTTLGISTPTCLPPASSVSTPGGQLTLSSISTPGGYRTPPKVPVHSEYGTLPKSTAEVTIVRLSRKSDGVSASHSHSSYAKPIYKPMSKLKQIGGIPTAAGYQTSVQTPVPVLAEYETVPENISEFTIFRVIMKADGVSASHSHKSFTKSKIVQLLEKRAQGQMEIADPSTAPRVSTPAGLPTAPRVSTPGSPTTTAVATSVSLTPALTVSTPAGLSTAPRLSTPAGLSTAPRLSTPAGLSTAPRLSIPAGLSTAPRLSIPAGLSTAPRLSIPAGLSTAPRLSTPAGLSTAPRLSTPAGLSKAPRLSTPASLSTAPRLSTPAGLSTAPRGSTPAGLSTTPRVSTPVGLSTAPRLSTPAGLSIAPRLSTPAGLSTAPRLNTPVGLSTAPRVSTPAGLSSAPRDSTPAGLSTAPRVSTAPGLSTAPRLSTPAGLSTAPRLSTPAGLSTAPRVSTPAGLSTAPRVSTPAGLSTAPRVSTPAGLSTAPRVSIAAGLSTAPRVSTPAGLSTAPRVSTPVGLSTAPRVSTPAGLLTAPRVSTPAGLSTAPRVSTPTGLSTAPRVSIPAGLSTAPRVSIPAGSPTTTAVTTLANLSPAPSISIPVGSPTTTAVTTLANLSPAPSISIPVGSTTTTAVTTLANLSTAPRVSTLSGLPTTIAVTTPVSLTPASSVLTSAGSPTTTAVTTFAGLSTALTVSTHADSPTTTAVTTFAGLSTALTMSIHADSPTNTAVTTFASLPPALTVSSPDDSPTTLGISTPTCLPSASSVSTPGGQLTLSSISTPGGYRTPPKVPVHAEYGTVPKSTTEVTIARLCRKAGEVSASYSHSSYAKSIFKHMPKLKRMVRIPTPAGHQTPAKHGTVLESTSEVTIATTYKKAGGVSKSIPVYRPMPKLKRMIRDTSQDIMARISTNRDISVQYGKLGLVGLNKSVTSKEKPNVQIVNKQQCKSELEKMNTERNKDVNGISGKSHTSCVAVLSEHKPNNITSTKSLDQCSDVAIVKKLEDLDTTTLVISVEECSDVAIVKTIEKLDTTTKVISMEEIEIEEKSEVIAQQIQQSLKQSQYVQACEISGKEKCLSSATNSVDSTGKENTDVNECCSDNDAINIHSDHMYFHNKPATKPQALLLKTCHSPREKNSVVNEHSYSRMTRTTSTKTVKHQFSRCHLQCCSGPVCPASKQNFRWLGVEPNQKDENVRRYLSKMKRIRDRGLNYSDPVVLEKFKLPLAMGWRREVVQRAVIGPDNRCDVYYHTPWGKKLRSTVEVDNYLTEEKLPGLKIENFTFWQKLLGFGEPEEVFRQAQAQLKPQQRSFVRRVPQWRKEAPKPNPVHAPREWPNDGFWVTDFNDVYNNMGTDEVEIVNESGELTGFEEWLTDESPAEPVETVQRKESMDRVEQPDKETKEGEVMRSMNQPCGETKESEVRAMKTPCEKKSMKQKSMEERKKSGKSSIECLFEKTKEAQKQRNLIKDRLMKQWCEDSKRSEERYKQCLDSEGSQASESQPQVETNNIQKLISNRLKRLLSGTAANDLVLKQNQEALQEIPENVSHSHLESQKTQIADVRWIPLDIRTNQLGNKLTQALQNKQIQESQTNKGTYTGNGSHMQMPDLRWMPLHERNEQQPQKGEEFQKQNHIEGKLKKQIEVKQIEERYIEDLAENDMKELEFVEAWPLDIGASFSDEMTKVSEGQKLLMEEREQQQVEINVCNAEEGQTQSQQSKTQPVESRNRIPVHCNKEVLNKGWTRMLDRLSQIDPRETSSFSRDKGGKELLEREMKKKETGSLQNTAQVLEKEQSQLLNIQKNQMEWPKSLEVRWQQVLQGQVLPCGNGATWPLENNTEILEKQKQTAEKRKAWPLTMEEKRKQILERRKKHREDINPSNVEDQQALQQWKEVMW